ncbi:DoxX family protein [Nocardia sp. XZ_19_385]|uniref:DoxX family protein n=1 Tax=Nocardia sp. XZ_19_385 TaxID=2769488 RepID=UPI00188F2E69|nr:DoxX family protein [Nocardia sp. XZ_19_385]
MNIALWITAGLLAAAALASGGAKVLLPKEKLSGKPGGEWAADSSDSFIKTLGVLEVLAAVGLILPAVLDIAPVLVPVTAVAWILLMIGAMITHLRYEGGYKFAVANAVYLLLAAFIAWGRFVLEPFA